MEVGRGTVLLILPGEGLKIGFLRVETPFTWMRMLHGSHSVRCISEELEGPFFGGDVSLLTHGLIDILIEVFSTFKRTGGSSFCGEADQLLDLPPLEKSQYDVFRSDNDSFA